MSKTISIIWSISTAHSVPSDGHTGLISTDIDCHAESKSLCPSRRLEMPALPLQGMSLRNGVRFSVQTTSRASCPCMRCSFAVELRWLPSHGKTATGRIVRVESMKFSEAQNNPESVFVRVSQLSYALQMSISPCSCSLYTIVGGHTRRYCPLLPKPIIPHRFLQPLLHCGAEAPIPPRPIYRSQIVDVALAYGSTGVSGSGNVGGI